MSSSVSVTLNTIPVNQNGAAAEYGISKDGGKIWTWQGGPEFTGLSSGTTYQFAARYGETDKYMTSDSSDVLTAMTDLEAGIITIIPPELSESSEEEPPPLPGRDITVKRTVALAV